MIQLRGVLNKMKITQMRNRSSMFWSNCKKSKTIPGHNEIYSLNTTLTFIILMVVNQFDKVNLLPIA